MTDPAHRTIAMGLGGLLLLVAVAAPATGILEVTATDATIATVSATPTSADPGPRIYSLTDKLTFSDGLTNVLAVWYAEITAATNNSSASAIVARGTTHTVADLVFARQNTGASFTTVRAVGAFDSDAASYTAPLGVVKSSQGSLALRSYDLTGAPDGGTATTIYWIYSAVTNTYYVDSEKDMTLGSTTVNPVSKALQVLTTYVYPFGGNAYAISSVGAAAQYVPTFNLGWTMSLTASTNDLTVLLDVPTGAREDTWSYTVRITAVSV